MSQTFVMSELRWLLAAGIDVKVYYHTGVDRAAQLDFEVRTEQVADAEALAAALQRDERTLCHNHFVYPATTLLVWPACRKLGIPFTLFTHAVDIFHEKNAARNRIAEIASDPLCLKIFMHGTYHRQFLNRCGVPDHKIAYNLQAVTLDAFQAVAPRAWPVPGTRPLRGILIARMVEKKGIPSLLRAMALLPPALVEVDIYGYGPLEAECRALAAELGLPHVHFRGPLDTAQACAQAIATADFMVVPSIVARNGDTEGFPTVIFEAMAASRPVVTTTVAAIPDFLTDGQNAILTEPDDPAALARGIARLAALDATAAGLMVAAGQDLIARRVGVDRTMQAYWDVWTDNTLSLFMVTYNTPKYDDAETTAEIIRRVLDHTTTPFTLTIVDNASEPAFRDRLARLAAAHPQIRLVLLSENRFCGPASNLALSLGDATHAIYICSKEGFVACHGWERDLLDHMRAHPGTGLAGYKTHMPRFTLGAELATHPRFGEFRNPDFARAHPVRPFQHVQGGVFILDRGVFARTGGFSDRLVQDMMDVEYSYFLESAGVTLGQIDSVASITIKTLPRLPAVLDDTIGIAHPLTPETARAMLDPLQDRKTTCCNLCGTLDAIDAAGRCGACGSTGLGRKIYQALAHDWRGFRGERALVDCASDPTLASVLGQRMFDLRSDPAAAPFRLIISDRTQAAATAGLLSLLDEDGLAFTTCDVAPSTPLERTVLSRFSRSLRSDPRPVYRFHRARKADTAA
jgi:glycosyltransferase involved in cell wall biosynthesis